MLELFLFILAVVYVFIILLYGTRWLNPHYKSSENIMREHFYSDNRITERLYLTKTGSNGEKYQMSPLPGWNYYYHD